MAGAQLAVLDTVDDERLEGAEELLELGAEDAPMSPQILPITAGVSAVPLVLTCTPKETVWPGWIVPFQLRLEAE